MKNTFCTFRITKGVMYALLVFCAFGFTGRSVAQVTTNLSLETVLQTNSTVTFDTSLSYTLLNTISITQTNEVVIDGGTNDVILRGSGTTRMFYVPRGKALTLKNLTLMDATASYGAAIFNDGGRVTVSNVVFSGHTATNAAGKKGQNGEDNGDAGQRGGDGVTGRGAAIYSSGNLLVVGSVFTNNLTSGSDGGIGGDGASDSMFAGNGGNGGNGGSALGGAVWCTNVATFTDCSFLDNGCIGGSGGEGGNSGTAPFLAESGAGGAPGTASGGAIFNCGRLNLTNCTFWGQVTVGGHPGSAKVRDDGTSANGTTGGLAAGGAIYNVGTAYIENSTLMGNTSIGGQGAHIAVEDAEAQAGNGGDGKGGGLANVGAAQLVNCTLAKNNVYGGTNGVSSVAENDGSLGHGIGGNLCRLGGTLKVSNTILAHGTGGNCAGGITDGGFNLSSDATCGFTTKTSRANIGAKISSQLEENGGTTRTLALPIESPAVDGITNLNVYFPPTDQRGFSRLTNGFPDIGAYEFTFESNAPVFFKQPQSFTGRFGTNFTLSAVVRGSSPMDFKWYKDDEEIPGATNTSYHVSSAAVTHSGWYRVEAFNSLGSVESTNARVTINGPGLFTTHPTNQDVVLGTDVTFETEVFGTAPLRYQWMFNGKALRGATSPALQLDNVQATNAGVYRLVVSNSFGVVNSSNANLIVRIPPSIVSGATNLLLAAGTTTNLTVRASGDAPLSYQWSRNGADWEGATNSSFSIEDAQVSDTGTYSVVVSNEYGEASSSAVVTVFDPIVIETQPQSQTVLAGSNTSFGVTVSGTRPQYQWFFNSASLPGATNAILSIANVQESSVGAYYVVARNPFTVVTSAVATLNVNVPARITVPPANRTIAVESNIVLSVTAAGTPELSYQWSRNGEDLLNETNTTLTVASAQVADSGTYSVTVSNAFGTASASASVSVLVPVSSPGNIFSKRLVFAGTNVEFSVSAFGGGVLRYQWSQSGALIPGATQSNLMLTNVQLEAAGDYSVVVSNAVSALTNAAGSLSVVRPLQDLLVAEGLKVTNKVDARGALSFQWSCNGQTLAGATKSAYVINSAQITNNPNIYAVTVAIPTEEGLTIDSPITTSNRVIACVRVAITNQPRSQTIVAGNPVTFSVGAKGTVLSYQWYFKGEAIPGATMPAFSIDDVEPENAGAYKVVVRNPVSTVTSSNAVLTVRVPARIVSAPQDQSVLVGSQTRFAVTAEGETPLVYQWFRNGTKIAGATQAALNLNNIAFTNAGSTYSVLVTNKYGSATASALLNLYPPAPLIVGPTNRYFLTNQIVVSGTVPDGIGITQVVYRVHTPETSATNWVEAVGTTNWAADIAIEVGTNSFEAKAISAYGESQISAKQYVRVPTSTLTLAVAGNGAIEPDLNGAVLQIGTTNTITARPGPGMAFSHWSIGATSSSPVLTFVMESNLVLQANFVESRFVFFTNTYRGLFWDKELQRESCGAVTFALDEHGVMTGSLQQGTNTYNLNAQFDVSGNATLVSGPATNRLHINLAVDLSNPASEFSGVVSNAQWLALLWADKDYSDDAAPQAGSYTALIEDPDQQYHIGAGVASAVITSNGAVSLSGWLPDNTSFSHVSHISDIGWSLYLPLYAGRGSLLSWLTFNNSEGPDVTGDLSWVRPALSSSKLYPRGLPELPFTISGFKYEQPQAGQRVLNLTNASVILSGGNLAKPLTNTVVLQPNNTFQVTSSSCQLTLKLNQTNGLVTGAFVHPRTQTVKPVQAAILQSENTMRGFFVGTNETGTVELR